MSDSLCAISHSWCGKIRSVPPPWRSSVGPSSCIDIAEHSTCQPGRPTPNGARHAGSSGARRLPQHEVERVATVRVVGVAAAAAASRTIWSSGVVRQLAEARGGRHVEVRGAVGEVGVAGIEEPLDHVDDPVDGLGRAGLGDRRAHAPARPCRPGSGRARLRRARGTGRRARAPWAGSSRRRRSRCAPCAPRGRAPRAAG